MASVNPLASYLIQVIEIGDIMARIGSLALPVN
jgi:hypothetical protein